MTENEMWAAVLGRTAAADGRFVFAVATTGVFCRPSCPARRPLRENVRFFADAAGATAAGFRPCLRCLPAAPDRGTTLVAAACRRLEAGDGRVPLAALAAAAGLSPGRFGRIFARATGLTPSRYGAAVRAGRARTALEEEDMRVTDAVFAAGFGSAGRFYAAADAALGMTPVSYRAGGAGAGPIRYALAATTLGQVLVAASTRGICRVALGDDGDALVADLRTRFSAAAPAPGDAAFAALVAGVVSLVENPAGGAALPLDLRGTAFQHRVWDALRRIPPGETTTYAAIAAAIGAPGAVRAVGAACGANPVAVAVPCHRVVRSDGAVSGYAWGVERKRALLAREAGAEPPALTAGRAAPRSRPPRSPACPS